MKLFDLAAQVPRLSERAELVASWYLRFNGYFPLSNFILHDAGAKKQPGGQITEADVLAIHLPYAEELIHRTAFEYIRVGTHSPLDVRRETWDFIIAEASSKECKFNWVNVSNQTVDVEYIRYCLRRFGFWDPSAIDSVANDLSRNKLFSISTLTAVRVRFLSLGVQQSEKLSGIHQVTFESALQYLKELFCCYGPGIVSDHKQWHPLICEIYKRLRGHKMQENTPWEVVTWLFPDAEKAKK